MNIVFYISRSNFLFRSNMITFKNSQLKIFKKFNIIVFQFSINYVILSMIIVIRLKNLHDIIRMMFNFCDDLNKINIKFIVII